MKKVNIEILKDCTDTGGFGVEGYEVKLTTNRHSITAFINMRNNVTSHTDQSLAGLFDSTPFTAEYLDKVNSAVQESFEHWNPKIKEVKVNL